jgi:hypothetical protein
MKTMLKCTLVVALFAVANTVFAVGNLKLNIQPIANEKAVVLISSLTDSSLKISVTDNLGRVVYYKESAEPNGNYRKVFDFSDLENGEYMLAVESGDLTTVRPFEVSRGIIKVGNEKTTIEPFFAYNDGLLRCTYLNFPKENLTLSFFDKNNLIYTKNIGRNFNVCEGLNLSKLDEGKYTAVLSTGDKEYTYEIEIN